MILEAGDRIGAAWRTRWDSLTLFTPRRYSALAGLAFPAIPTTTQAATMSWPTWRADILHANFAA